MKHDWGEVRDHISSETILSLLVTSACQLRCMMCATSNQSRGSMALHEWMRVIDEAIDIGVRKLVVTGGEPLIDPKARSILGRLTSLRSRYGLRIGLTTNGIALGKQPSLLDETAPSYIDISIDGTKSVHEFLRGTGSYGLALKGLDAAQRLLDSRDIYVCMIMVHGSLSHLPAAIDMLSRRGIRNIYLQPLMPLGRGAECGHLVPNAEEIMSLVFDLLSKSFSTPQGGLRIKMWLYPAIASKLPHDFTLTAKSRRNYLTGQCLLFRGSAADIWVDCELKCSLYKGNVLISPSGLVAGCCVDLDENAHPLGRLDRFKGKPLRKVRALSTAANPCGRYDPVMSWKSADEGVWIV